MLLRLRQARLLPSLLMTIVGLAVLVSLGTWQWQRKGWKELVLRTLDQRAAAQALSPAATLALQCQSVPADLGGREDCEFLKVRLTGRLDPTRERHVFAAIDPQRSGLGGAGYWIFTPLMLDGGGEIIVNRGHVPQRLKAPETRHADNLTQSVTVEGLLRRPQVRGRFDGQNNVAGNVYYVRDLVEMGLAPRRAASVNGVDRVRIGSPESLGSFYLDAIAQAPAVVVPVALGASPRLSNRHLEYAMTWYAFAATLAIIFLLFARGRLRA